MAAEDFLSVALVNSVPETRLLLRQATPYRLDDQATELLVEYILSMARDSRAIERTRTLGRLPHRVMWVEWNNMRFTEVQERISGRLTPDRHEIPFRRAFIFRQDPIVTDGSLWEVHPTIELRQTGKPMTLPFAMIVSTEGPIIGKHRPTIKTPEFKWMDELQDEWNELMGGDLMWSIEDAPKHLKACAQLALTKELLASIMQVQRTEGVKEAQQRLSTIVHGVTNTVHGFARTATSILCMLNEVPIRRVVYQPAGHYRDAGRLRPYMKSSLISISLEKGRVSPLKIMQGIIREAAWKCRAHMVKGFWRADLTHAKDSPPGENWVWQWSRRHRRECWQIWIKPHQRGDAALGWVNQEYEVTR